MGWIGEADGKYLVAGAVDVEEGLGDRGVLPFEDGGEGPADEVIVAGADDVHHELAVGGGAHEQTMLYGCSGFEEGGGDEFAEAEPARHAVIAREMRGDGDATYNDGAGGLEVFGHFDGHDAAERKADEGEGFAGVDLLGEPDGVVGEFFVVVRGDPVDICRIEACG